MTRQSASAAKPLALHDHIILGPATEVLILATATYAKLLQPE